MIIEPLDVVRLKPEARTSETFSALLERLYREQHMGPVVLHFAHGVPRAWAVQPEPIPLDTRVK